MRGSRFVGLDSISITSVLGSALPEQESSESAKTSVARTAEAVCTEEVSRISGSPDTSGEGC